MSRAAAETEDTTPLDLGPTGPGANPFTTEYPSLTPTLLYVSLAGKQHDRESLEICLAASISLPPQHRQRLFERVCFARAPL